MPIDNSPKKSQLEVLEEIRDASGGIYPLTGTSTFDCRAYISEVTATGMQIAGAYELL